MPASGSKSRGNGAEQSRGRAGVVAEGSGAERGSVQSEFITRRQEQGSGEQTRRGTGSRRETTGRWGTQKTNEQVANTGAGLLTNTTAGAGRKRRKLQGAEPESITLATTSQWFADGLTRKE